MVSAKKILKNLPLYENKYFEITENQSVSDIMSAIKNCHNDFADHYDLIAQYFIDLNLDIYETCFNIFDFLKENTDYFQESEKEQKVMSPSAILTTKKIDCKNYALFSCGILDAINRTRILKIPYCYRFVSDNIFKSEPGHVFCVAFPGTDEEIYIDPIPQVQYFNQKINYYYSTDKKYKKMSLYKVSGIEDTKIPIIGLSANDVKGIIDIASSIFTSRPNPNDWVGWDRQDRDTNQWYGSSVRGWVINDGDSIENEAVNIASYIKANGIEALVNSGHPVTVYGTGWRDVTLEEIADKFRRGGLVSEAQALLNKYQDIINSNMKKNSGSGFNILNAPESQKGSTNILWTVGIALGAILFIFKKGKK